MLIEMLRKDFNAFASKCDDREDWRCETIDAVCKDYLCPKLIQLHAMGQIVTVNGISKIKE